MIIVGCDYHAGFQHIAFVDTDRSSNHDRGCERRDAWVGPSLLTRTLIASEP
jgi:hypothetical protein